MSDTIVHARYQFTSDEFVKANRYVLKSKLRPAMRVAAIAIALVMIAIGVWLVLQDVTPLMGYVGLAAGAFWLTIPFVQPILLRRAMRRDPDRDALIEWRIDDEGTRVIVGNVEKTSVAWSAYTKALITREGYLLYRGAKRLSWLPFKAFASRTDHDAAQALIEQHVADIRRVV